MDCMPTYDHVQVCSSTSPVCLGLHIIRGSHGACVTVLSWHSCVLFLVLYYSSVHTLIVDNTSSSFRILASLI